MSESRNHITSYNAADIQKYLDGRMSASEMHAIEKAALDDPFLADAIEGFDIAQQQDTSIVPKHLKEIRERIHETTKRDGKVIGIGGFGWWKLAAAAVIVLILGTVLYTNIIKTDEPAAEIAVQPPSPVKEEIEKPSVTQGADSNSEAKDNAVQNDNKNAAAKAKPVIPTNDDAPLPAEARTAEAKNYSIVQPQKSPITSPAASERESVVVQRRTEPDKKSALDISRGDSVSIIRGEDDRRHLTINAPKADKADPARSVNDELAAANDPRRKSKSKAEDVTLNGPVNFFNGRVTDMNNQPIANASVQLIYPTGNSKELGKRSMVGITTNQYGYFQLPSADSAVKVQVTGVGFTPQTFNLRNDVAINQVQLTPSSSALNEVVVTGMGKNNRQGKFGYKSKYPSILVQNAEPVNGWIEFDKYIADNKKTIANPADSAGEVVVSFQVNQQSQLSSFKIEQSLSAAHDAEAIRLIKEGPVWRLLKGKKARVMVIIRF